MTQSHIGARVFIVASLPATNDAAGFEALAMTEVKGLVQGPQFGRADEVVEVPDLSSGYGKGVKGAGQGQGSELMFRDVPGDPGQAALKALANSPQGTGSIKVAYGTGAVDADGVPAVTTGDPVEYAQGFYHSPVHNQATTTSYQGFSVSFRQNAVLVEATEPAS